MIRELREFAMPWRRARLLRCSFCGRTEKQVERLVAGAAAYICETCVGKCVAVIQDHADMPTTPGAPANLERTQEPDARPR